MKLGVIGAGNMASAIIGGIVKKGLIESDEILCSSPVKAERDKAQISFGIKVTENNRAVVQESEIVIFAVKPQVIPRVIEEVKDDIDETTLFISATSISSRAIMGTSTT